MRKSEQMEINMICETEFERAKAELREACEPGGQYNRYRLRTCTAWVIETEKYYLLQSYGTLIACINKTTDTLFDVLRIVYGYTATSAQHISKFEKDYGQDKWGCHNRYTAR